MRKRSEVAGTTHVQSAQGEQAQAEPVAAETGTTCAVCKLPQLRVGPPYFVSCSKGHNGAFGVRPDGTKVYWTTGEAVQVGAPSGMKAVAAPKPDPRQTSLPGSGLPNELAPKNGAHTNGTTTSFPNTTATVSDVRAPNPAPVRVEFKEASKPAIKPTNQTGLKLRTITVARGERALSPITYNTFRVGAVSATFEVEDGVDILEATMAAYESLGGSAEAIFQEELANYIESVKQAGAAVEAKRAR